MGQIVGGAAKPKRCNLNKLSQLGTPAAGEHILVSSDNSMNAAGQGNFDAYVVGDGSTAATALPLLEIDGNLDEIDKLLREEVFEDITLNADTSYAGKAISSTGSIWNYSTRIVYCKLFSEDTEVEYDVKIASNAAIFYAMGGTAGNPTNKTIVSTGAEKGSVIVPAGGRLYWSGYNPSNSDYETSGPGVKIIMKTLGGYKTIVGEEELEAVEKNIGENLKYRAKWKIGSINNLGQDAGNPTHIITSNFHRCHIGETLVIPAISGVSFSFYVGKYTESSFDSFTELSQTTSVTENDVTYEFDYDGYYLVGVTMGAKNLTENDVATFEKAIVFTDSFALGEAVKTKSYQSVSFPFAYERKDGVASYVVDPLINEPVELINGHTYKLIVNVLDAINTPSTFNINITRTGNTTTILRIATLGNTTSYSGGTYTFTFDAESRSDYLVGLYSYSRLNARFETLLQDVTIDNIVDSGIVARNRYKEAAIIEAAALTGRLAYSTSGKLTLLHFSDLHGNTSNLANIVLLRDHYSYLLDDTIHTGDSVANTMSDANPFESVTGAETILNVIGNHEAWISSSETDYNATEKQTYDKIFAPSIANWGVVQPSGAAENGYCYYYKDYQTAGFRLIILDSVHWHYRNGTSQQNAAQKTWFEGVLSDAKENSLSVVCATHYPPQSGIVPVVDTGFTRYGTTENSDISDGWYAVNEMFDCVDSFISAGGDFAGWLIGHTHSDYFGKVKSHPLQQMVVIGTAGSISADNKFQVGTVAQDNANIITFEKKDGVKIIKIVKIGCDMDVYGRSKKVLSYDVTNGSIIQTM